MAPNVDSAILEALGLDLAVTQIASHGGSGFASTFKISSQVDGQDTKYFVKTGSGSDAELMFKGMVARTRRDQTMQLRSR
jgi:protein-ribulosamine 3-kinase